MWQKFICTYELRTSGDVNAHNTAECYDGVECQLQLTCYYTPVIMHPRTGHRQGTCARGVLVNNHEMPHCCIYIKYYTVLIHTYVHKLYVCIL